jgi:DNA-directed RNA polymerase subunit RPC12/RpoP
MMAESVRAIKYFCARCMTQTFLRYIDDVTVQCKTCGNK